VCGDQQGNSFKNETPNNVETKRKKKKEINRRNADATTKHEASF